MSKKVRIQLKVELDCEYEIEVEDDVDIETDGFWEQMEYKLESLSVEDFDVQGEEQEIYNIYEVKGETGDE